MNRGEKLIKNTAILSIGTLCTKIITFVTVPLFSAWLSTEDYGTFDLLCTYVTLLIPFLTFSTGEAVFRFLIDCKEVSEKKKVVSNSVAICCVGFIVFIFVLLVLFLFTRSELIIPFLCLLITEMLYSFMSYLARGFKALKDYAIAGIIFTISMCIFVILFVRGFNLNIAGMVYGYAAGYLMSILYLSIVVKPWRYFAVRELNTTDSKKILKYSLPLIPNTISWWINNVSDRTIINIVLGASFNGIYAIANKVPAICTALFSVFHISWQENASSFVNDEDKEIYFNNVYNNIIPALISVCMGVLSINGLMFKYIFDIKYYAAQIHVPILITAIIISFVAQFYGGIYVAFKETKINGGTTIVAAVVNIVINVLLIQNIGLFAASISTLISYLVIAVIRKVIMKKYIILKANKKSVLSILVYVLFCGAQIAMIAYGNSYLTDVLEYTGVLFAMIFFAVVNWGWIYSLINKITKKA